MKRWIALLPALLLFAGCGLFTDYAQTFGDQLRDKGGYTNVTVVDDLDDDSSKDKCVKYDTKNPRKCLEKKKGKKKVGYDSFNNVSGDCVVELETGLEAKGWKIDSVNGVSVELPGNPDRKSALKHIKNYNAANDPNLCTPDQNDLKNVA